MPTTSTTDLLARLRRRLRPGPAFPGAITCAAGLALLMTPELMLGALGLELLATGFWLWARRAPDRDEQIARWSWLRRPAAALWLAAGCHAATHTFVVGEASPAAAVLRVLAGLEAIAVLWAGLDLVAALPLERPYSERPGPLAAVGPWLPVLLPAAGFAVLWRHADSWVADVRVRDVALALLAVTLVLATLRAFSRGRWVASLRWLAVADTALAAFLVGLDVIPRNASLVLWLAAFGGRAALLAGELRGAAPRRRPHLQRLWRTSGWATAAALAWPALIATLFGGQAIPAPVRWWGWVLAPTVALAAWVSVRRLVEAPERRSVVRPEPAIPFTAVAALLALMAALLGLALVWWAGFQSPFPQPLLAALPALVGGFAAWWWSGRGVPAGSTGGGTAARAVAHGVFRFVTGLETRLVRGAAALARTIVAPVRDIHTGDAQEYLLLLVALCIFALLVPILR